MQHLNKLYTARALGLLAIIGGSVAITLFFPVVVSIAILLLFLFGITVGLLYAIGLGWIVGLEVDTQ